MLESESETFFCQVEAELESESTFFGQNRGQNIDLESESEPGMSLAAHL